jgi:hypothetical protein
MYQIEDIPSLIAKARQTAQTEFNAKQQKDINDILSNYFLLIYEKLKKIESEFRVSDLNYYLLTSYQKNENEDESTQEPYILEFKYFYKHKELFKYDTSRHLYKIDNSSLCIFDDNKNLGLPKIYFPRKEIIYSKEKNSYINNLEPAIIKELISFEHSNYSETIYHEMIEEKTKK